MSTIDLEAVRQRRAGLIPNEPGKYDQVLRDAADLEHERHILRRTIREMVRIVGPRSATNLILEDLAPYQPDKTEGGA